MPEITVSTPARLSPHSQRYSSFKGVDFSCDPAAVDRSRSPWAVNLISMDGAPEKRPGWRKICSVDAPVRGIYRLKDAFAVHAGGTLYRWDGESQPQAVLEGLTGEFSSGFYAMEKLFILTGEEYIYIDGERAGFVKDIAYAPITSVNCGLSADYESGAFNGERYEDANTVTHLRRNSFSIDPFSTWDEAFAFVDKRIDPSAVLGELSIQTEQGYTYTGCLFFAGEGAQQYFKSEVYSASVPDALYIDMRSLVSDMRANGDTSTAANITYPAEQGMKCPIFKCRIAQPFSAHVFVSANPEFPNADWYSELNDPTYFKDISYTQIGGDSSAICAYLPTGDKLAVIKEAGLQDAGVYLRSDVFDDVLGTYFPVKRGVSGCGAVGLCAAATLVDDPMFLTSDGVMGIASEFITGERVLRLRSTRINNKLLREDISNACAGVWKGHFVLGFENGHVYLADSRMKSYPQNTTGSFEYDWYYWEGVPMCTMCAVGELLYFGCADGRLCVLGDMQEYSDYPDGEPVAIVAEWSTKFDDDGCFMLKKNMTRRGCGIFLKGSRVGNVKLAVRTDKDRERVLAERKRGVFNFEDMDFESFSFEGLPRLTAAINRKVKKYTAIQIICRSDEPDTPFGILSIERRYVTGYFNK